MRKYLSKVLIAFISLFLLIPMVVKADIAYLGFKADTENLYLVEGDTVKFTLKCVNYKASPAYQSSLDNIGEKQLNTHEATIIYDDEALEYVSIFYSTADDVSDVMTPEDSKIDVDTSTKGQLKYSFEKDFGSDYSYNVTFTFKVKEGASLSKTYKISVLGYEQNTKEFKVVKKVSGNTTEKEKTTNDNKDVVNYVSYGANAVLLIAVIVLFVKRK